MTTNNDQIPEGITVGTEYGNIIRSIKKEMKKYIDGDIAALDEVFLHARMRNEYLQARAFAKKSG